jgi:hypothetical protein
MTTYYLSTTGNNNNNGTSTSTPWATLEKFLTLPPQPGDTLLILGGTYTGTGNKKLYVSGISGTAGNPITIKNYNGETVIFDGGIAGNGGSKTWTWWVYFSNGNRPATGGNGCSYWVIEELIFQHFEASDNAVLAWGNWNDNDTVKHQYNIIRKCIWRENYAATDGTGNLDNPHELYPGGGCQYITVEYCQFYGAVYGQGSQTPAAGAFHIYHSPGGPGNIVRYNIFDGYNRGFWVFQASYEAEIYHNTFLDCYINMEVSRIATIDSAVEIYDNAGETADSGTNIFEDTTYGDYTSYTNIYNNFWNQSFDSNYYLDPSDSGWKAATDGTDAGARNAATQKHGQARAQIGTGIVPDNAYEVEVLADNPVFLATLEESSGSILDIVGLLTGTAYGSPTYGVTGPISGKTAIDFPTGNDYFSITDPGTNSVLDLGTGNFSVEYWFARDEDATGVEVHLYKGAGTFNFGITDGDKWMLGYAGVGVFAYGSVNVLSNSVWHHVVWTRTSGGTNTLYVDGVSESTAYTQSYTAVDTNNPFIIGRENTSERAAGKIAYVAIYKSVLDSTRVAAHYSSASSSKVTRTASAQAQSKLKAFNIRSYAQAQAILPSISGATYRGYAQAQTKIGKVYYIAPSGSNSTGNGSKSTPWRTMAAFFSVASAGDILFVREGTYTGSDIGNHSCYATGTANAPILISGYPGDSIPVYDGNSSGDVYAIWFRDTAAYITVQDIKFTNWEGGDSAVLTSSGTSPNFPHHLTWQRLTLHKKSMSPISGTHGAYWGNGVNNSVVQDCFIDGNSMEGAGVHAYHNPSPHDNIAQRNIILNWSGSLVTGGCGVLLWITPENGGTNFDILHNTFINNLTNIRVEYADSVTIQDNAGTNSISGPNIISGTYSPTPTNLVINNNYWDQEFSSTYHLLYGETGRNAATDGKDAGALNYEMAWGQAQTAIAYRSYYISPTGSDTTGNGSYNSPWASINKFIAIPPSPGYTLYCRGGTYTGISDIVIANISGTVSAPITIRNYPGDIPIFQGTNTTYNYGLLIQEATSYLVIDGLQFTNFRPTSAGVIEIYDANTTVGPHHITIRNCKITQVSGLTVAEHCIDVGKYSHDVTIEGCVLIGNYVTGTEGCGINNDHAPVSYNMLFQRNIFYDCAKGIYIWGSSATGSFLHNSFINCYANIRLNTNHGAILVRDNAGTDAAAGTTYNLYDPVPTGTTADHNYWDQEFDSTYHLLYGETGRAAASDGKDAGALSWVVRSGQAQAQIGLITRRNYGQAQAYINARTYYISPTGSGTVGSLAQPCALSRLATAGVVQPGDTWILLDGTYGTLNLDGSSGVLDGTSSMPVTVRAQNERGAHLIGPGNVSVLRVANLSYWTFVGLRIQNSDLDAQWLDNVDIFGCDHLTFRRCLFHHSNQGLEPGSLTGYNNVGLVLVQDSDYCTFEENEFWDCISNFLQFSNYTSGYGNHVARRNYFNYGNAYLKRRGAGISIYPSNGCIIENNFMDEVHADIQGAYSYGPFEEQNRFFGNIMLDDYLGYEQCREDRPTGSIWRNNVAIANSSYVAMFIRGSAGTLVENNTVIGGYGNYAFDEQEDACFGSGSASITFCNNLGLYGSEFGFIANDPLAPAWTTDHQNQYGATGYGNFTPSESDSRHTSPMQVAPNAAQLRCPAFIVPSSPYYQTGASGANVGATVLYTYENGTITTNPIWNTTTSEILSTYIGAVVTGVNDGSQNANKRLLNFGSRLHPNITADDFASVYTTAIRSYAQAQAKLKGFNVQGYGQAQVKLSGSGITADNLYEYEVITDNPIFLLPMEESSGNLTDIIGGKIATANGSPTYSVAGPIQGKTAIQITGTGTNYFSVAHHTDLNLADGPFTLEMWYYRDADLGSVYESVIAKGVNGYVFGITATGSTPYDDRIQLGKQGVIGLAYSTTDPVPIGSWLHWVITRSATRGVGSTKVYKNGVEETGYEPSTTTTLNNTTSPLLIGQESGTNYANGRIAYVAIYKTVLSSTRIAAHYAASKVKISTAQARTKVIGPTTYKLFAQSQGKIKRTYKNLAQAQTQIAGTIPRGYAQASAAVAGTFTSVSDTFTRSVTDGLGTADTGGTYTVYETAADWDINGSKAVVVTAHSYTVGSLAVLKSVAMSTVGGSIEFNLNQLPGQDEVYYLYILIDRSPTSVTSWPYSITGPNIMIDSDGNIYIQAIYNGSGLGTTIGTYTAGDTWLLKFTYLKNSTDALFKIKTYKQGTTEPGWQLVKTTTQAIDPSYYRQFAGHVGLLAMFAGTAGSRTLTLDNWNLYVVGNDQSAQAQARIKRVYQSFAQAQTQIIVGSFNKGFSQANAAISGAFTSVVDTFTRTVASGLGTADTGGTYYNSTNAWSVNGSKGVAASNYNLTHFATLPSVALNNLETSLEYAHSALPTSGTGGVISVTFHNSGTSAPYNPSGNFYDHFEISILLSSNAELTLTIWGGSYGWSYNVESTYTAGDIWILKTLYWPTSTRYLIKAKTWKQGTTEPDWQIIKTNNDYPIFNYINFKGYVGLATTQVNAIGSGFTTIDNWNVYTAWDSAKAQAQAQITRATNYKKYGQAQTKIKQVYRVFAQARVNIKQTYKMFGAAQVSIINTYKTTGQAQVSIYISNHLTLVDISTNGWVGVVM